METRQTQKSWSSDGPLTDIGTPRLLPKGLQPWGSTRGGRNPKTLADNNPTMPPPIPTELTVTPAPVSLAEHITIHSHVPPPRPFQLPAWDKNWDDNFANKACNTPLLSAPPPSGASTDKFKLDDALDDDTVASITLSQALLLPPTDLTTLPDGTLDTLFATINQHLKELARQSQAIAKKYDNMLALVKTVQEFAEVGAIKQNVQLAVAMHTSTFGDTVALAESSLNQRYERTSQLLVEASDIINQDNLHQQVMVAVDSAVTATLATPDFSQSLDSAGAMTLVTPEFSRHLDAMIAMMVTAQVDQYIDCAATREVTIWVTQKLDNVFESFSDKVLKQKKR
jgi:hypothetical protein